MSVTFIVVGQKLRVYFGSQFECTVHRGKEVMAARARSGCLIATTATVRRDEGWGLAYLLLLIQPETLAIE